MRRWRAGAFAGAAALASLSLLWLDSGPAPRQAHPVSTATGTPRCSVPAPAGTSTVTVRAGQLDRTVLVHVPPGYPDQAPVPLLLALHGSGSTAARQERSTGLDATADEHTFIVAYPQAGQSAGAGFAWNVPGATPPQGRGAAPDDVAYLRAVISALRLRYCIDPGHIYGSGFSGGARMISAFACTAGSGLAGIAAVGGVRAPQPCRSDRPISVVAFHGTADQSNPYLGHGQAYWTYSVPQAVARWAHTLHCSAGPRLRQELPGVEVTSYSGCAGGAAVALYTLLGVGHHWPVPPRPQAQLATAPPAPSMIDIDEILWAFLDGQITGDPLPFAGSPAATA